MAKRKHSITFTQPSLTQQHQKEEVDINNIMARYIKTGVIDHVNKYQGQYTENRETDYHSALNLINRANSMFLDLPSQVREKFKNDPGAFLDFVENPDNHEKLREMGLTNSQPKTITDNEVSPSPTPSPVGQQANTPSETAPASPASAD